jgi:hypothetical protein
MSYNLCLPNPIIYVLYCLGPSRYTKYTQGLDCFTFGDIALYVVLHLSVWQVGRCLYEQAGMEYFPTNYSAFLSLSSMYEWQWRGSCTYLAKSFREETTLQRQYTGIWNLIFPEMKLRGLVPILAFMFLWAIFIFLRSVCLYSAARK